MKSYNSIQSLSGPSPAGITSRMTVASHHSMQACILTKDICCQYTQDHLQQEEARNAAAASED